jgi:hypothetical protein
MCEGGGLLSLTVRRSRKRERSVTSSLPPLSRLASCAFGAKGKRWASFFCCAFRLPLSSPPPLLLGSLAHGAGTGTNSGRFSLLMPDPPRTCCLLNATCSRLSFPQPSPSTVLPCALQRVTTTTTNVLSANPLCSDHHGITALTHITDSPDIKNNTGKQSGQKYAALS